MRRKNTQPIGEVLQEYIREMSMGRKLRESRIHDIWEELLGKNAASLTRKLYIKDQVLFVHLNSSVLRNEILMMRETLLNSINDKAGEKIVNKIVLK